MPDGWGGEAVTIRWTSSTPLLRKMLMASRPERSDSELEKQATRPPMVPSLWFREFVQVGGLMAYSIDLADIYRRVANLVDKILRGANPGDIPFYQPTKYELVINLKTAKALGLTVPPTMLARADVVIE